MPLAVKSLFHPLFINAYCLTDLEKIPPIRANGTDSLEDNRWRTDTIHQAFVSLDSLFEYYPLFAHPMVQRVQQRYNAYNVPVSCDTLFNWHFWGFLRCPNERSEWRYFSLSEIFLNRFIIPVKMHNTTAETLYDKHKKKPAFSLLGLSTNSWLPSTPNDCTEQRFLGDAYLDFNHYAKARGFWYYHQKRYRSFIRALATLDSCDNNNPLHPPLRSIYEQIDFPCYAPIKSPCELSNA